MISQQVMLIAVAILLEGCAVLDTIGQRSQPLSSPYGARRIWAVTALRNESGSLEADGLRMADHLAQQLENVPKVDVLPINRTIAAMQSLKLTQVDSLNQAVALMETLGADGLVVGTITAYDPYDVPTLGLAIELYTNRGPDVMGLDTAKLRRASTSGPEQAGPQVPASHQPVSVVSGFYRASDGRVRRTMQHYARDKGPIEDRDAWHRYRVSMDLYSQFVAYVISERLMAAETARLTRQRVQEQPAS